MGRFLVGVLVAVLAIWGYDRVFGGGSSTPHAQGSGLEFADAGGSGGPGGAGADKPPSPLENRETPAPRRPLDDGSLPGGGSFGDLDAATGVARDRLVGSLRKSLTQATSFEAKLALLGPDNGFLRSADGRAAVLEIEDWIVEREPAGAWDAVRNSSRLLEASLNGPVGRQDVDAVATLEKLRSKHESLVRRTVFDPADLTGARRYVVQRGESLTVIARTLSKSLNIKLQTGTLQLVNRISNPNVIGEGQVIKVPVEPVHAILYKSSFVLAVYVGDVMVRAYRCAHGKEGHETPEAQFQIGETIERPDWHYNGESIAFGDPRNPLGSHFVKFIHESYTGFGAHGTNEPDTIGTQASLGCVRLGTEDIIEFASFMPRGSVVEVRR